MRLTVRVRVRVRVWVRARDRIRVRVWVRLTVLLRAEEQANPNPNPNPDPDPNPSPTVTRSMPPRPTSTRRSCARRCSHPEKPTEVDRRERVQQCNSQISRQYSIRLPFIVIIKWINLAETCIRCFFLALGHFSSQASPISNTYGFIKTPHDRCPSRLGAPLLPSGCSNEKRTVCRKVRLYGGRERA